MHDPVVAVIGVGGVGGYYGIQLANRYQNVHLVVRSGIEEIHQQGLTLKSSTGDILIRSPNIHSSLETLPKCDLIIVCTKTTGNHNLPEFLKPVINDKLSILILQNGMGTEQQLHASFPSAKVMGGLAFLCAHKQSPSIIIHEDYGALKIAPLVSSITQTEVEKWAQYFSGAGVKVQTGDDILYNRWEKLVWNIPFNGLSVVTESRTGHLLASDVGRRAVHSHMMEVINAANHLGHHLTEGLADQMISNTINMVDYAPSMLLDYENKKPLEVEYIYENPAKLVEEAGFSMPITRYLAAQLRIISS